MNNEPAPVKFTLAERDRRPPVQLPKTQDFILLERDAVVGESMDLEDDGLVGEDNPPVRWVHRVARPRRR